MPLMADTGSAAKKRCSVPGAHNRQSKRLVTLACDLCDRLVAAHANGTGHSQSCHAVAYTSRNQQRVFGRKATGVISIKASSMDTRSTRGVSSARIAMTCALTSR